MREHVSASEKCGAANVGQNKVVLLWTLVLTFGCTAVLVDAFREEDAQPIQAVLSQDCFVSHIKLQAKLRRSRHA